MTERFLTYLRAERRYSPLTVKAYGDSIAMLCAFLGVEPAGLDPAALTPDDLREWVMELGRQKMNPASVNRHISAVKAFCRFLRREGAVTADPSVPIRLQKKPLKLPAHIEQSRMGKIAARTEEQDSARDRLIILLLYATGIRLAELVALDRTDLSADRSEMKVHGKGGRERIVPLLPVVGEWIGKYTDEINRQNICLSGEKALILGKNGGRISRSEVYRVVNRVLAEAGVQGKRSPHVLRHTFATHLLDNGAGLREIQELLGHSSLAATQVYTHNTITKLQEAYRNAHPRARDKK